MAARLTAYLVALIVSVTFIAGLIVGAQRDDDGPVDLIVVNGNVYTADGDSSMAEAVAVQGNKILLVGSNRDVQRLRRPQTVVVDARGGAVLPGFNNTSVEFVATGLGLQRLDLSDASTPLELESAIKAWAAAHPDREWVLGHSLGTEIFEDYALTRHLLDALVPDRPAFFVSEDGKSAWVNTRALAMANITRRTASPGDGTIVKETRSGEPTGVLLDAAIDLVEQVVPAPTRDERLAALRAAIDDAHRRGITSVQDIGAPLADLELYDALRKENELELRVYAAVRGHTDLTDAEMDRLDEIRAKYSDDPLFKTGAVALVAEPTGEDDLGDVVAALDERGWQVIIQAIGERAVRIARDAVEYASRRNATRDGERRHRVEKADGFEDPVTSVTLAGSERRAVFEAIDDMTKDAAWASFDEHRKGTLERDMLADLVILTNDIFASPAERAAETEVAVTIFNGRVVYSRPVESND